MIRDNKGFTMIELIIVIAIIGIIGALLVPAYNSITASARLTTDISTIQTVQRMVDLYHIEQGEYLNESNYETKLKETGYLDTDIKIQTGGDISFENHEVKLDISKLDSNQYSKALSKVKDQKRWCTGSLSGGES